MFRKHTQCLVNGLEVDGRGLRLFRIARPRGRRSGGCKRPPAAALDRRLLLFSHVVISVLWGWLVASLANQERTRRPPAAEVWMWLQPGKIGVEARTAGHRPNPRSPRRRECGP